MFLQVGKGVEMGMPDWPQLRKSILQPSSSSFVTSVNCAGILPKLSGIRCPASLLSTGLGSNVSIWLGPPAIIRKMTDFALAGKCGGLARERIQRRGPIAGNRRRERGGAAVALEQREQGPGAHARRRRW